MLTARDDFTSVSALIPGSIAIDSDTGAGGGGVNLKHALALNLKVGANPISRDHKSQNRHRNNNYEHHKNFRDDDLNTLAPSAFF